LIGFETDEYKECLDFEHVKEYLKDGVTPEKWNEVIETRDMHDVMKDYMPFAFEKARDERGISASRSISHYIAWLWLADDNELWKTIEEYHDYGIPQLTQICEYLGIPVPK